MFCEGACREAARAHAWAHTVGLRYCTNKQVTKLLARTCEAFEPRHSVLQIIGTA